MSLLRPATSTERFFLMTNSQSFMNTAYSLTVSARGPLQKRHVQQAVTALTLRIPVLRRGFDKEKKSNDLWVKELDQKEGVIDCQVLDSFGNVDEELLKMASHKYDVSNGPLFQVRVFRRLNDDPNDPEVEKDSSSAYSKTCENESTSTICCISDYSHMKHQQLPLNSIASADTINKAAGSYYEEHSGDSRSNHGSNVKNTLKLIQTKKDLYHYTIFFGILHAAADGYTNLKILPLLLSLLNDALQDKISHTEKQFEPHEGFPYTEEIVLNGIKSLDNQQALLSLKTYLNSAASASGKISRILTTGTDKNAIESKIIHHKFSTEETARLLALCKKESVTVNSFFTALINIAVLEMYIEKISKLGTAVGKEKKLAISGEHTVDLRRYWSEETQRRTVLGPHISMVQVSIDTEFSLLEDTKNVFWPYAKKVQEGIKRHTSPIYLGMHLAYEMMCPLKNSDDLVLVGSDPRSVFSVTNMGDITKNFPREGDGDFIRLIDVNRCVSIHKMSMMTLHFLHSFQGRLTYDIVYSTRYFDQLLAGRLHGKVLEIIQTL